MKKINALVLCAFVSLSMLFAAQTDESGLFTVKYRGDSVMITGCTYDEDEHNFTTLTVPAEINGLPVTELGEYALSSYENYDLDSITRIDLPDTLTKIGYKAFAGLEGVTSFVIPDSVTTIEEAAFKDCYALKSIRLPASLTAIPDSCFDNCGELETVRFASNAVLESIGESAFDDCTSLKEIKLPETVRYIADYAFGWCSALSKINIPVSVRYIGQSAFHLTALESVIIPRPTHIACNAFDDDTLIKVFRGSQASEVAEECDFNFMYLPAGGSLDIPEYPEEEYELYEEDDDDYYDYYDDDDYSYYYDDDDDDDEDLPPVTEEQLASLVEYIEQIEKSGNLPDSSYGTETDDGLMYLKGDGISYLICAESYDFPFLYYRIDSYVSSVPNFIYVLYGRATGSNLWYYSYSAYMVEGESADEYLENTDIESRWARINGYAIPYRTQIVLDGKTYEVLCTDIDDDTGTGDDYDDYDDDDYDYDLSCESEYDWDEDEFIAELTSESMTRKVDEVTALLNAGLESDEDVSVYTLSTDDIIMFVNAETDIPYLGILANADDGRKALILACMRGTSMNRIQLRSLGYALNEMPVSELGFSGDDFDDLYASAEEEGVLHLIRTIWGETYDVFATNVEDL